jgi:L-threonylcarbamoyladenylate synthase
VRTIAVDPVTPDAAAIAEAAAVLRAGGLVAFPTETVYGLGAHALDPAAVTRIFAAKGRPFNDPLIVHVAEVEQIAPLVAGVPPLVATLAARFWPGPLTIVLPRAAAVPDLVTAGLPSIALRIPAHPVARALLRAARVPVAAPSANLFSRPSPTRADHVRDDLGERIDLLLDAGPTPVGVESTVLDLTGPAPVVLRPGAVPFEALTDVAAGVTLRRREPASDADAMPAPGMLSKHYSPRTPLTLYEGSRDAVVARLRADRAAAEARGHTVAVADFGASSDLAQVAAGVYATLRELDRSGADMILATGVAGSAGLALAIQDRLRRAAVHVVHV